MTTVSLIKAKELVKKLDSDKPAEALKAAEKVLQQLPERKTIHVDMTSVKPEVTFTGEGWCAMDIKFANAAIIRKFREMQRELYRKEYEKK